MNSTEVRPVFRPRLTRAALVTIVLPCLGLLALGEVRTCLFAFVARVPCPACGLSRATRALLRGDLAAALEFHPLRLLVLPFVIFLAARTARCFIETGSMADAERGLAGTPRAVMLGVVVLVLAVWISRFFGAFGGPVTV